MPHIPQPIRSILLGFSIHTFKSPYGLGCPDLHDSCQNILDKIYVCQSIGYKNDMHKFSEFSVIVYYSLTFS